MAALPDGPLTRQKLRTVLNQWHWTPAQHPAPFPGPSAERTILTQWVNDIVTRAEAWNIPIEHWTNVVLSWIPAEIQGNTGIRERLLAEKERRSAAGQLVQGRFWPWAQFVPNFFDQCASATRERWVRTGLATVGSAVALPIIGIPLLGAVGFASGGVVAGSIAAGLQSAIYGGATSGLFSVLQSIGARAAFPVVWQVGAGLLGSAAADAANNTNGDVQNVVGVDNLGDIGDS